MPFGKYQGHEIENILMGYLEWLLGNVELYGVLRREVDHVLFGGGPDQYFNVLTPVNVISIYRRLAWKWHPDSQEQMRSSSSTRLPEQSPVRHGR